LPVAAAVGTGRIELALGAGATVAVA